MRLSERLRGRNRHGEKLTVNYSAEGGGHQSPENDWFTRMGVTPYVDWT